MSVPRCLALDYRSLHQHMLTPLPRGELTALSDEPARDLASVHEHGVVPRHQSVEHLGEEADAMRHAAHMRMQRQGQNLGWRSRSISRAKARTVCSTRSFISEEECFSMA